MENYLFVSKKIISISLISAFFLLAVGYFSPFNLSVEAKNSETYRQLTLFGDVFQRVREAYVEEVPDKKLIKSAINGMLANLDPHSSFMDDEDFEDMQVQTKGAFGGLGIEVTMEDGFVKVVSPIDDTPADKANIQPGDLIIGIDDEGVYGLTLDEAVEKIQELTKSINYHNHLYYQNNESEISDYEFDQLLKEIEAFINKIPDHPKPGILFYDISTLILNNEGFCESLRLMSESVSKSEIELVAGIDARGFIFASGIASKLNKGLVMLRKKGKLPGSILSQEYSLEYGKDTIEINVNIENKKVLLVDDLLATGGTANAALKLLKKSGAKVQSFLCLIELSFLNGKQGLDVPFNSLIRY